jgi:predicted flap endonuclease-1-like 5' DNA nuclease
MMAQKEDPEVVAATAVPADAEVKTEVATEDEVKEIVAEAVADGEKGDDLTKIVGVGKVYAGHLIEAGITTFAQVAAMTEEEIQVMETKHSFRGDFKDSVASAKELAGA